uniref:Uncharacterized protein n=1 Tax=Arundo donax TaxID=35708 RepID=A0A0A9H1L8_ARUDO
MASGSSATARTRAT